MGAGRRRGRGRRPRGGAGAGAVAVAVVTLGAAAGARGSYNALFAWGDNRYGELGLGSSPLSNMMPLENQCEPQLVRPGSWHDLMEDSAQRTFSGFDSSAIITGSGVLYMCVPWRAAALGSTPFPPPPPARLPSMARRIPLVWPTLVLTDSRVCPPPAGQVGSEWERSAWARGGGAKRGHAGFR